MDTQSTITVVTVESCVAIRILLKRIQYNLVGSHLVPETKVCRYVERIDSVGVH